MILLYYIYMWKNKINNKKYFGQTNNIDRRYREYKSYSFNEKSKMYNLPISRAIRKYGLDNFDFKIVDLAKSKKEINVKEIFYINFYNTIDFGYNIQEGGQCRNYSRKLTNFQALKIIKEIQDDTPFTQIAEMNDISLTLVSNINNGLRYRQDNITYPIKDSNYKTFDDYKDVVNDIKWNIFKSVTEIAEKHNIGDCTAKKINSGDLQHQDNIKYPIRQYNRQKYTLDLLLGTDLNVYELEKRTGYRKDKIRDFNKGKKINKKVLTEYNNIIFPIREHL